MAVRKRNVPSVGDGAFARRAATRDPGWRLRLPPRALIANGCAVLASGVLAAVLSLHRLGSPSLWFDEILSVERASQSLPVLWRIVNASEPNMALYYFLLHAWLAVTARLGLLPTEVVVRLPSALLAPAASIVLFLLARRFLGLAGGVCAAFLYVCNDFQLVYTQEARAYALQMVFLLVGWYALLVALTCERRRRLSFACYICAMTLAVYTHYFSLLVLLAQGIVCVSLLVMPTPWRVHVCVLSRAWCMSFVIIVLLIAPMLYASRVGAQTGWIPVPTPGDVLRLLKVFGDDNRLYLLGLLALILVGLLLTIRGALGSGGRLGGKDAERFGLRLGFVWALLCWLWVPIVVSYLVSQRSVHLFLPRYLISVLPAFCLLAASGCVALPWRWLKMLLVPGLLILTLLGVPRYYASAQVEDWRTAALWIEHQYRARDGLVCFDTLQGCQIGLDYYFQAYPGPAHVDADAPGAFSYVQYDLLRPAYRPNVGLAVSRDAVQRYAARHLRLFYVVARLPNARKQAQVASILVWLRGRYRLLGEVETGAVTVYLFAPSSGAW